MHFEPERAGSRIGMGAHKRHRPRFSDSPVSIVKGYSYHADKKRSCREYFPFAGSECCATVFIYSYFLGGGRMDLEFQERVMLERVELIARLTTEGFCKERDREIALSLIADIAANTVMTNKQFSVVFSAIPLEK